jgi:hypothetical protein
MLSLLEYDNGNGATGAVGRSCDQLERGSSNPLRAASNEHRGLVSLKE